MVPRVRRLHTTTEIEIIVESARATYYISLMDDVYDCDAEWVRVEKAKDRARNTLQAAVRRGSVVKPDACQRCGKVLPRHKLQGHHHDHSKPREVEWICQQCHQPITNAERACR